MGNIRYAARKLNRDIMHSAENFRPLSGKRHRKNVTAVLGLYETYQWLYRYTELSKLECSMNKWMQDWVKE
jgi:hypothetical protein